MNRFLSKFIFSSLVLVAVTSEGIGQVAVAVTGDYGEDPNLAATRRFTATIPGGTTKWVNLGAYCVGANHRLTLSSDGYAGNSSGSMDFSVVYGPALIVHQITQTNYQNKFDFYATLGGGTSGLPTSAGWVHVFVKTINVAPNAYSNNLYVTSTADRPHYWVNTLSTNVNYTDFAALTPLVGDIHNKYNDGVAWDVRINTPLYVQGQPVLTQTAAAATYLNKTVLDPNGDNKIDTAQITGAAPLIITNSTQATTNTGALTVEGGIASNSDAMIRGMRVGSGPGSQYYDCTALGVGVLGANVNGYANTAMGYISMNVNTTGTQNSAFGKSTLRVNTSGSSNSAIGSRALWNNTTGSENVGTGTYTLYGNVSGNQNVALGSEAGSYLDGVKTSLPNPSRGVYLGYTALGKTAGETDAIVIGANAKGEGTGTTVIGNANTVSTHLYGKLIAGKNPVPANANDPANSLVVGNGTTATPKDAIIVNANGTKLIGTTTVEGTLTVSGDFIVPARGGISMGAYDVP